MVRRVWHLIGPFVTCIAFSQLTGFLYTASHGFFGASDLYSVLILTLPFAALIGPIARLFRSPLRTLPPAIKYPLAGFVGVCAGFLWTLLVASAMGMWFLLISVAPLPCWMAGGAAAMVEVAIRYSRVQTP